MGVVKPVLMKGKRDKPVGKYSQFESPGYLDLLATVYAAKGDYFQAVVTEKLAVSVSEGAMKDNQMKNVEKYLLKMIKK